MASQSRRVRDIRALPGRIICPESRSAMTLGVAEYLVRSAPSRPGLDTGWDDPPWAAADTLEVAHFRPEGSDHRPLVQARLLHAEEGLCGIFRVEDRYVLSRHTRFGDPVYQDSCVEIFLQPKGDR